MTEKRRKIGLKPNARRDVVFRPDEMSSFSITGQPFPMPKLPADRSGAAAREHRRQPPPKPIDTGAAHIVGRDRKLPSTWNFVHSLDRLEEAYEILARIPMRLWPKQYGNAMPTPVPEQFALIETFELEQSGQLKRMTVDRNVVRRPASAAEIERMEQALTWCMKYIRDDPEMARYVGLGALWSVYRLDHAKKCRELGIQKRTFQRIRMRGLRIIAQGLIKDRVPVS